jgi:hypothetical protein
MQGISDLQELLDLHRRYIRQASGALAGSRLSAARAARVTACLPGSSSRAVLGCLGYTAWPCANLCHGGTPHPSAAAEDCLTFGGSPAVKTAVEGALQRLVSFSFCLRGAVRSGAGWRAEETWTQVSCYSMVCGLHQKVSAAV